MGARRRRRPSEKSERARLDALARRRAAWRRGILERGVRGKARAAVLFGVVDLEHDGLVAARVGKRQRIGEDRFGRIWVSGAPDLDDREAPREEPLGFVAHELAHAL